MRTNEGTTLENEFLGYLLLHNRELPDTSAVIADGTNVEKN